MYSVPVSACQVNLYYEYQTKFLLSLSDEISKQFFVRIGAADYNYQEKEILYKGFNAVKFDDVSVSLFDRLTSMRISVSTYNGTSYLETLILNFPTIIFWDQNYWEIRKDAEPFFKSLEEV